MAWAAVSVKRDAPCASAGSIRPIQAEAAADSVRACAAHAQA